MTDEPEVEKKRNELRAFIKARKLKVKAWSRAAGISSGIVRNFLEGRSKTMTQASIDKLADAAGVAASEIFPSTGTHTRTERLHAVTEKNLVASANPSSLEFLSGGSNFLSGPRDLPILGYVKGGSEAYFIDQDIPLGSTVRLPMLANNRDAYAVRVHDVSMSPAMDPGYLLFVDPHRPVLPGNNVVIQLHDGQSFIKKLKRRTERAIECEQHNPPGPVVYKPSEVKAIHLVVLISPFEL
jgi:phage repressor protein C with HTH and peptisase S24 domain